MHRRSILPQLASVLLMVVATGLGREAAIADGLPAEWVKGGVEIEPGISRKVLTSDTVGGFRRSFRLHVPAGYDPSHAYPLVVALHGGMATARIFEDQSGLSAAADRHGFFVVYPNGMGVFSLLRHWNGGYCCGRARKIALDDPGYLDRVRLWVAQHYPIDSERHYVVGYSNGGMLAYWYAATRASELAGLGIWASSVAEAPQSFDDPSPWQMPWPETPLPAFIAHGVDDPRLPYLQASEPTDQRSRRDGLLGAVGSARAWARANGCPAAQPTRTTAAGGALHTDTWCHQQPHKAVELLGIEEWGHDWPGPKRTDRLDPDHPLYELDLSERMWQFFQSLHR